MKSQYFESVEALSDYQVERELGEALHYASLPPEEKFRWLEDNWGRLQDGASSLRVGLPEQMAGRSYSSIEEKNRFDDNREMECALKFQKLNNALYK